MIFAVGGALAGGPRLHLLSTRASVSPIKPVACRVINYLLATVLRPAPGALVHLPPAINGALVIALHQLDQPLGELLLAAERILHAHRRAGLRVSPHDNPTSGQQWGLQHLCVARFLRRSSSAYLGSLANRAILAARVATTSAAYRCVGNTRRRPLGAWRNSRIWTRDRRVTASLFAIPINADRRIGAGGVRNGFTRTAWGKPKEDDPSKEKDPNKPKFDPRLLTPQQLDIVEYALKLMVQATRAPGGVEIIDQPAAADLGEDAEDGGNAEETGDAE